MDDQDYLKQYSNLAAYIDRISALVGSPFHQKSFKRYVAEEKKGNYYRERHQVSIDFKNGVLEITASDDLFKPEEAELQAIRHEIKPDTWPESVPASEAAYKDELLPLLRDLNNGEAPITYAFWDRTNDKIKMVQQRFINRDGEKRYVAWSKWSDGKWRALEPHGLLPMWLPRKSTNKRKIMLHEGAKAAENMNFLLYSLDPEWKTKRKNHPWIEELEDFEHWGIIGGALALHRSDYKFLQNQRPIETIYVCDNDWPGKDAIKTVSLCYGQSLKTVFFSPEFPPSWDLGDPFPEGPEFWGVNGRFIGKPFSFFLKPATYATKLEQNPRTGRFYNKIRDEFAQEWFHCLRPEVYIHRDWPNVTYDTKAFNDLISPFSNAVDTATLLKKDIAQKASDLCYNPGSPYVTIVEDGRTYINTHVAPSIPAEKGDCQPFLDYMEQLIPREYDRFQLMKWIATLIARPDIKMQYGVLLISKAYGVGKSTLGEKILEPILGKDNVSKPTEMMIVDSQFNDWCAHKRLAVIEEIYSGHSSKAANKLKHHITADRINVNIKFQAQYYVDNWCHFLASSNSLRALKLDNKDRRWLIPEVTETKKPPEYWESFNKWLQYDGGLNKVKGWAESFIKEHGPVEAGQEAPFTATKGKVSEATDSEGIAMVREVLRELKIEAETTGKPQLVLDTALVDLIKKQLHDGKKNSFIEKPLTIRNIAEDEGWFVCKTKAKVAEWGIKIATPRLLVTDPQTAERSPGDLAKEGFKPVNMDRFLEGM